MGYFYHVCNEHQFENSFLFYRMANEDENLGTREVFYVFLKIRIFLVGF